MAWTDLSAEVAELFGELREEQEEVQGREVERWVHNRDRGWRSYRLRLRERLGRDGYRNYNAKKIRTWRISKGIARSDLPACLKCGTEIQPSTGRGRSKKFCTRKCASAWHWANRKKGARHGED